MSSRFTTVEGLIKSLSEHLKDTATAFYSGDSQCGNVVEKTEEFLNKMNKILSCEMSVDIVLNDPAGNSYIQVNIIDHHMFNN